MNFLNLSWLRQNSGSMLILLIFGVLIVVFAFQFGPGSQGFTSSGQRAGSVNGDAISVGEVAFYYNQLYEQEARRDKTFDQNKAKETGLLSKAYDQIINRFLLAQTAESLGFSVSDEEVGRDIVNSPVFNKEGGFDKEIYRRTIQYYYKMSLTRYEEKHKADMAGERIRSLLADGFQVSEELVYADWYLQNEKVSLDYIKFPSAPHMDQVVEPSEAQIAEYAKSNEEKIKTYYDDNKQDFVKGEEVKASHILVKVEKTADADQQKAAKEKADKLYEQVIAEPEKFAELATAESDDKGSAKKGGDLGFFQKGRMIKEFEDTAFAMAAGEISKPVKSNFGWHIIKVEEKKPAIDRKIEDEAVKLEIAQTLLKTDQAVERTKVQAQTILDLLKDGKTMVDLFPAPAEDETVDKDKPKVESTNDFSRNASNYVPRIGKSEEVMTAAWDELTKEKPLSEKLFVVDGDVYIISLKDRKVPKREDFDSAKEWQMRGTQSLIASDAFEKWLDNKKDESSISVDLDISLADNDNF